MSVDTELKLETPTLGEPAPAAETGDDVAAGEFFRRIYQFCYSKTVGLVIILAVAVLVLIGAILLQASGTTWADEAARAAFMEQATAKYGGWAGLLGTLGLLHVFSSLPFYVLIVALAVSITACTTHRIPVLWSRWRSPKTHATARFFERARYRAEVPAAGTADDVTATLADHLQSHGFRVLPGADRRSLYADRFAWGGFGTVLAHLSFLVILAAFLVSGMGGVEDYLDLPVGGDSVAVGHGSGLEVQATSFEATYSADGRPLDYVSHLVVYRDGVAVAEQDVRVNEPLRVDGFKFHQNTYGLAADVVVTSGAAVLFQGAVPFQWTSTDGSLAIGTFELPEAGLTVDVITPASGVAVEGLPAGSAAFQLFRTGSDESLTMGIVAPGEPFEVGDYTFVFARERQLTGILLRHDPGAIWMWIGSVLLVAGMTVTFLARHRRYWFRVEPSGACATVLVASSDKEDSGLARQFDELAQDLAHLFRPETDPE